MKNKKIAGYKIDFANSTITMNYTFASASECPGSEEYTLLKTIRADFPEMKIVVKSGRKTKTAHTNKRLTYANMETYIQCYSNSTELISIFETVKNLSKPLASPYQYVADWFIAQFPNYKNSPTFKDGKLYVLPVPAPVAEAYKHKTVEEKVA